MPTFRVTVLVDVDDQPVTDFPLVRRIQTNAESAETYQQVSGGGAVPIPHGALVSSQVVILQANQPLLLGIGGGQFSLNSNAFVLIMDGSPPFAGLSLTNASGNTATIKTLIGGS